MSSPETLAEQFDLSAEVRKRECQTLNIALTKIWSKVVRIFLLLLSTYNLVKGLLIGVDWCQWGYTSMTSTKIYAFLNYALHVVDQNLGDCIAGCIVT